MIVGTVQRLFPKRMWWFWERVIADAEQIREIRLRIGQPIIIRLACGERFLDEEGRYTSEILVAHRCTGGEMEELLMHLCHDSPYAFAEKMKNGYLTVQGGHRIGVAGQVVVSDTGTIQTMKQIAFMNIRFAHELFGVADGVMPRMYQNGLLRNALIISPPGCGKTTLLRDMIRQISNGNPYGRGMSVGVVDERSELGGAYMGRPQNDVGCRTDILDGCPKEQGMMMLLRSMAPEVIAVDELGSRQEVEALRVASACGIKLLATIHGNSETEVAYKFPELMEKQLFDCYIKLGRRKERYTCDFLEADRSSVHSGRNLRTGTYDSGQTAGQAFSASFPATDSGAL